MIIAQKDKKIFGIVHLQEDFNFIGFCINSEDNTPQKIDIYVNNQKIDTILCNISNSKLENIYDIEVPNLCFEYQLAIQYIKEDTVLEFKYENSTESIVNSPIKFSEIKNFNKKLFLYSLKQIDEEKPENIYCPNTIGFIGSEDNLNDKDFMNYINDLKNHFTDTTFRRFSIGDSENNSNTIKITCINDINKNCSVLIINPQAKNNTIDQALMRGQLKISNVFITPFIKNIMHKQIIDIKNNYLTNEIKNNLELFKLTTEDIIDIDNSHILMLIKSFNKLGYQYDINLVKKISLKDLIFIHITHAIRDKKFIVNQKNIFKNITNLNNN